VEVDLEGLGCCPKEWQFVRVRYGIGRLAAEVTVKRYGFPPCILPCKRGRKNEGKAQVAGRGKLGGYSFKLISSYGVGK
jgi:hypothetical protein